MENGYLGVTGAIGGTLMDLLMADDIEPGSDASYQTCKNIYVYHPMGRKLAQEPANLALSQRREISIPSGPENALKEAFEREWNKLKLDKVILRVATLASVYGVSTLVIIDESSPINEALDAKAIANKEIRFKVFDPLNTAGSYVTNQNPNALDFQDNETVSVSGRNYHLSRCCTMINEEPIYLEYSLSAFGYTGRSVYQRALFPLKSFIASMLTDHQVQEKAGLLIVKSKKAGSVIDNIMQRAADLKRNMLKGAKTGNVLEIGHEDSVETLNMTNADTAMKTSRENIIHNIALASGRPAMLLSGEAFTQGFGEGTEDAGAVADYIDSYRLELQPLYDFLDPIVQWRAWNPEFYQTIQERFPDEYGGVDYEAAVNSWRNAFTATWPNFLKEPDSEGVQVEETKARAVISIVQSLKEGLDPENKAVLYAWAASEYSEMQKLFVNPLEFDEHGIEEYNQMLIEHGQIDEDKGGESGKFGNMSVYS